MTIGLVDIDGHAVKKKWGATIYPNLALAKIARYHRERGDSVEWAIPFVHYDRVYMSKIFNFTPDDLTCYDTDEIIRGGTGYDLHSRLPEEIDRLQPDYSIYPNVPSNTAYGFLTRGCPNRCPWCVVPIKEGAILPYMDIEEIAIEGRTNLVLMDNNILAAGDYRDPNNPDRPIPQWQKDMAQWANKKQKFHVTDFANFRPRKGFKCEQYLSMYCEPQARTKEKEL